MTSTAHHESAPLTRTELRRFGLTIGIAVAVIFGFLLPWLFSWRMALWPFIVGGAFLAAGLLAPLWLQPVQRGWMWFAYRLGAINSRIILGLMFFGVITPTGILRRLFGADPLGLRATSDTTYRKPSHPRTPRSLERPF